MTTRELQVQRNQQYAALLAQAKGKECAGCNSEPRVAWLAGAWTMRCNCWPRPPALHKPGGYGERRIWGMTERALERAKAGRDVRQVDALMEEVRSLLPSARLATTEEIRLFCTFCISIEANPFIREAYLIKYQADRPASIVLGVGLYLKWASRNPAFGGCLSGIVVKTAEGALENREGTILQTGETLIGGWCKVYRAGREHTPTHTVSLKEYWSGGYERKNLWDTHQATMIEKVAIVQSLRRVFPEDAGQIRNRPELAGLQVVDETETGSLAPALASFSAQTAPAVTTGAPGSPAADLPKDPLEEAFGPPRTAPQKPVPDPLDPLNPAQRQHLHDLGYQSAEGILKVLQAASVTAWLKAHPGKTTADAVAVLREAKGKQP